MRARHVVAIASIVCLACSDSTGLSLKGSPVTGAKSSRCSSQTAQAAAGVPY